MKSLSLNDLLKEAKEASAPDYLALLEDVIRLLEDERKKGLSGHKRIEGGLTVIPPEKQLIVIGDLHGDFGSLALILCEARFFERPDVDALFLGDYIDRGAMSPEVFYAVLKLKVGFPERVILLRGNHEGPADLPVYPHDLPFYLQSKYGKGWKPIYEKMMIAFDKLYHVAIVEGKYLFLHGGPPTAISSIEDLANADASHPKTRHLEEILWNDPSDVIDYACPSPRGAGMMFGECVTESILSLTRTKVIIRSHEPCYDGVKVNHKGKVLTVFSRKGSPYFNSFGAYLELDLLRDVEDCFALKKIAKRF